MNAKKQPLNVLTARARNLTINFSIRFFYKETTIKRIYSKSTVFKKPFNIRFFHNLCMNINVKILSQMIYTNIYRLQEGGIKGIKEVISSMYAKYVPWCIIKQKGL